jgi:hypothetical protein
MRHVGTTRTAVAVVLFAAAALSSTDSVADQRPPAAPAQEQEGEGLFIAWGGDVTLGSSYGNPPDAGRPLLRAVRSALRKADIATLNYEGTFGPGGASKCGPASENCFAFQAPAGNARTLRWAGVDVVNHANNHAWDYGAVGWRSSRDALKRAKVDATGAPGEIVTVTKKGTKVAFAGFSTYPWSNPMGDEAKVRALIRRAARNADVVVAIFHAGAEGAGKSRTPRGPESAFGEYRGDSRRFARVAVDAGADLVLGSGPHVLRGLELYKHRLIAYSLGNLAGYKNFGTGGRSALSALLTVGVTPTGRFYAGRLDSLRLDGAAIPHKDTARAAARFVRGLSRADFPKSRLTITAKGLIKERDRGHR